MFGISQDISEKTIDFDELARLYISQRFDETETPEDFLVRFVKVREAMLARFKAEPRKPVSIPHVMPTKKPSWTL
ncbi:MAG: hypothetical protein IJG80_09165 [Selenomonadaceae bacterium]|nr:hypothetical protein [Selenomonadaceae bacterium]MBQ3434361.1 hypothetical protein [Selenomonadaceae bacterium]